MYADRYAPKKLNPGSLAMSVGIVGGLVVVAALSNTVIKIIAEKPPLVGYTVPPPPAPPPPEPPRQEVKAKPAQRIDRPETIVPSEPTDLYVAPPVPGPAPTPGIEELGGGGGVVVDPPKPPPVVRPADVDARYARDFQPIYPTEERRAGREGVVTLKVLIGVDGRVVRVERIGAASDAFWRVTERQALGRWRFKPATRDGVAYESWKTMTVRFRLEEDGF